MATAILHTYELSHTNVWANKVLIVSMLANTNVDVKISDQIEATKRSDNFIRKFPLAKCMAFEHNSLQLTDCDSVLVYLSHADLTKEPKTIQLLNISSRDLHAAMIVLCYPALGIVRSEKQETSHARAEIFEILHSIQPILSNSHYLQGDQPTLVDVSFFCELLPLYEMHFTSTDMAQHSQIDKWMLRCAAHPSFSSVVGVITQCTSPLPFNGAQYAKLHPKDTSNKSDKKSKKGDKDSDKKAEKAEKKAGKKEKSEKESKPKDSGPFGNIAPTSFDLETWKRVYCNNDLVSYVLPWLWENLDYDGFSFWHSSYKFADELAISWKVENFITGFLRRLDTLRKYSFGVLHLCFSGVDTQGNYEFNGVWMFRGSKLAFELTKDWGQDLDLFNFKPLNPRSPEDKLVIQDYFSQKKQIGKFPLLNAILFK